MDFKDAVGEGSKGSVIVPENWRKGEPVSNW